MAAMSSFQRKPQQIPVSALPPADDTTARASPRLQLLPDLRADSAILAVFTDLEVDFFRRGDELEATDEVTEA